MAQYDGFTESANQSQQEREKIMRPKDLEDLDGKLKLHEGLVEHECNAPPLPPLDDLVKRIKNAKDGEGVKLPGGKVRTFDSGATRDADDGKFDYEGFLSPVALERYAEYMHKHRKQSDGKLRASDNWQKGIPMDAYMKSLWRHFMDLWKIHRGYGPIYDKKTDELITREEALCAVIFNAFGQLHELRSDDVRQMQCQLDPVAKFMAEEVSVIGSAAEDSTGDFQ